MKTLSRILEGVAVGVVVVAVALLALLLIARLAVAATTLLTALVPIVLALAIVCWGMAIVMGGRR